MVKATDKLARSQVAEMVSGWRRRAIPEATIRRWARVAAEQHRRYPDAFSQATADAYKKVAEGKA